MNLPIPPPNTQTILTPLLSALPAAAVSPTPPESLLPYLSPILRQRVQLLSTTSSSTEPWLPLLCYDANPKKTKELAEIALNEALEAHPVSGEVELDWEEGIAVLFKRTDEETFQAGIEFVDLKLWVRLIWCTGDAQGAGGPDGWRIGEVSVMPDAEDVEDVVSGKREAAGGWSSIGEAEKHWRVEAAREAARKSSDTLNGHSNGTSTNRMNGNGKAHTQEEEDDGEDDDDDYWALYDNTPSRTPAMKRSPVPPSMTSSYTNGAGNRNLDEDAYYAQYASVQPAMDSHDPDEADQNGTVESTLDGTSTQSILHSQLDSHPEFTESSQAWEEHHSLQHNLISQPSIYSKGSNIGHLEHPRPASSPSSSGSSAVMELEKKAAGQESSEMAVRQHISSTLKSLWRLSRGTGMEMEEFRRVVGVEVNFLAMLEDQEEG